MVNRWAAAAAIAALLPAAASGQAGDSADTARLIRAIEIRRHDIFNPSEVTGFIPRAANALHFVTRPRVIRRELLFRAGQPWDSAAVAETARNLRSLGIFREVTIDSIRSDSGLVVRVTTGDGWSTRPITYLRTSGSTVVPTIGVEELNFLGTATLVSVRYRIDPDRSTVTSSFRQPRLLAGRIGLAAAYSHLSDGDLVFAELTKPWFSLSGRRSWRLDAESRDETILRFFDGIDSIPRFTLERRYALGSAAAAWALRAGPDGYFRLGVSGQLRRDDYADKSRVDTLGNSISGALGVFLQWRKAHYLVSTGLEGFSREQDIDVSTAVGFGVNLTPKTLGYAEDGVGAFLGFLAGFGTPRRFVQFQGTTEGRFTSAGLDSGSVHLAATAFVLPGPRHLAVFHAAAGWQERPLPGATFDLGLGLGPRGFKQHAFTGDRAFFTTAEYRYTATENFLNLTAIGVAGFVDYGGAWYHGSKRRTGWSVGTGLRFGLTRATDIQSNRVDLVYRGKNDAQKGGFTLVIERGFAFTTTGRLDR